MLKAKVVIGCARTLHPDEERISKNFSWWAKQDGHGLCRLTKENKSLSEGEKTLLHKVSQKNGAVVVVVVVAGMEEKTGSKWLSISGSDDRKRSRDKHGITGSQDITKLTVSPISSPPCPDVISGPRGRGRAAHAAILPQPATPLCLPPFDSDRHARGRCCPRHVSAGGSWNSLGDFFSPN